ncbi:hypothetical protein V492_03865 [Pseudogymnoascus sp. VKM F-4246]|nr:hypothetical protein V492_03865 [Pseudogymnoascus sp. VKM F-4246]
MGSTYTAFDDSRIRNHPDKELLSRIGEYFEAFATGDYDKMNDMVADDYRMSDIFKTISLHGSSAPDSFAILENVVRFTLKVDPPEEAKAGLPPGIKKGDSTGMVMLPAVWWNKEGKVTRELEYGRLMWPNFDSNVFNTW